MRGKCPKCGAVFAIKPMPSLIHVGPWRYTKCPACGKSSMMNNFVSDPITWPPEEKEGEGSKAPLSEDALKRKRIEDSKYEDADPSSHR
ncbi:MAG: hypothetical protein ABSF83_11825 [Nitrososphaerales archaeon]|jgi:rRNA maturation protein Nop10